MMEKEKREPEWAWKAEYIEGRPEWIDKIPHLLWDLGEVFFPIPRGRKGWGYPHHMGEYRYFADSKILNAYLEAGFGYGIACDGSTAVVDIDERQYVDEIEQKLPSTVGQITGSREGKHLFFSCPGLNNRQILHHKTKPHDCESDSECWPDEDGKCVKEYEWEHLGEIKCDPHGYVVGPGSVHPSGNKYGPLEGDQLAEVEKEVLLDSLSDYIKPEKPQPITSTPDFEEIDSERTTEYDFYKLSADDVIPWLEPEKKVPHPVHGSSTGKNFEKMEDGEKFYCWRHDYGGTQGVALNAQHFLAIQETGIDCDAVRRRYKSDPVLHWKGWKRAVEEDLVSYKQIPYKVAQGFAIYNDIIALDEELSGDVYWEVMNSIKIVMESMFLPTDEPE